MTAVLSTTLFAEPVTQVQAADLHIVGATDAADATARSVPQVTTVAGATFGENDALAVADTVTIDGRELRAGLWYWPVAIVAGDVNALVQLSAGGAGGAYIRPANGATLETGKRYIASTGTLNTPPPPADGGWFTIRNDADAVTGGGALDRVTVIGPIRTAEGQDLPGFPIAPGLEYVATWDATASRWKASTWSPIIVVLDSTHNGQGLRGHAIYEIVGDAAGMTFTLPATPAGHLDIRLQAGSTFPVTIEQANTGGTDQFRFETGVTGTSFVLDVAHSGQHIGITGEPFTNCWFTYRDWEIANINKNSAPWQANHGYTVGELVTANRISDGQLTIFAWDDSAANGGTPTDGTSGATFDATEEGRWIEIGAAALNLEILQSVEIQVRGYVSSVTHASQLVLIDAAGNDYDSADWVYISDDSATVPNAPGTVLQGSAFSPPVNDFRTIVLRYTGGATRRGLSAIRLQLRGGVATTGVTSIKTKYFSGIAESWTNWGALSDVQTYTLTETFDFVTDPVTAEIARPVTADAPAHGLDALTLEGQGFTRGIYDGGTVRLATTTEAHDVILLGVEDVNTLSIALPDHAYEFPGLVTILDTLGAHTLLYRSDTTDGAWSQSPANGDPIARYLGGGWVHMLPPAAAGGAHPVAVDPAVPDGAALILDTGTTPPTLREGTGQVTGPAVERAVFTRNRDQTVAFGDLNFMCPSAANSSLHMRRGSNPSMNITHFSTKWSNQQGAASEQTPNFTVTTGWRIFRSAGLNLTQHNNWQEGTFVCNGWLYNIQVFVGSGWNNNRFSCTRWRLDAVKGDPGADGINGVNGVAGVDAASIDHVSQTAGDSSPGTTDTYTLWADAGETNALGTYDVPIPSGAVPLTDVLIDSSPDSTSQLTNYNFALGMTYGQFRAQYKSMRISIRFNNLYSDAMSESYVLEDFPAGTDLAVQEYTVHSSNAYHIKATVPSDSATTLRLYAEGNAGFHHAVLRASEKP